MRRSYLILSFLILALRSTYVLAEGASFDCLKAAAPIEQLICSDPQLITLDGALGEAFASFRQRLPEKDRAGALAEQRTWLDRALATDPDRLGRVDADTVVDDAQTLADRARPDLQADRADRGAAAVHCSLRIGRAARGVHHHHGAPRGDLGLHRVEQGVVHGVAAGGQVTGSMHLLEAAGARILLDAAQLAPHRPVDMTVSDVDYLVVSGHKLYAPFGAGALIGRPDWLAAGEPMLAGGGAVRFVSVDEVLWADLPDRAEAGTPNIVGAVALGVACRTLAAADRDRLAAHETALIDDAQARLEAIPGEIEDETAVIRAPTTSEEAARRVTSCWSSGRPRPDSSSRKDVCRWAMTVRASTGRGCAPPRSG